MKITRCPVFQWEREDLSLSLSKSLRKYSTIQEFNVDSKAEEMKWANQLNLAQRK